MDHDYAMVNRDSEFFSAARIHGILGEYFSENNFRRMARVAGEIVVLDWLYYGMKISLEHAIIAKELDTRYSIGDITQKELLHTTWTIFMPITRIITLTCSPIMMPHSMILKSEYSPTQKLIEIQPSTSLTPFDNSDEDDSANLHENLDSPTDPDIPDGDNDDGSDNQGDNNNNNGG
ncbi:hypothetical protein LIER_17314 [Lithospermum erythrorhizon]|uniref:Uncharacterized protein n=1 Tax=Lithospermum erythrorhizon TaxID=34254 RepID=A0AAV3QFA5_LITER